MLPFLAASLLGAVVASAQILPGQLAADVQQSGTIGVAKPVPVPAGSPTPTQINSAYEPISGTGRIVWWAKASFGPMSIFDGAVVAGYQTAFDHPPQWGPGWDGFGKRFALRQVDVALSNGLQAGAGAIWGEDPRYFRAGQGSFGSRIGHAVKDTFMDRYRGGEYGPAFARYIGIAGGNFINNSWHPAGETSNTDIEERIGTGFASKLASNVFQEFWPDLRDHLPLMHHSNH